MEKRKEQAVVLEQTRLSEDVYSMWLQTAGISSFAKAGQFIAVYCGDNSRLLPRPISICEIDSAGERIRIVYRVVGKGTEEFSRARAGDILQIMGPLGNGFPIKDKKALLIGGGIGVPPLLELAKQLPGEKQIVLGYRDSQMFLKEEFEAEGPVFVATDNGSAGTKGTVIDAINENGLQGEVLYACGPLPMLRAVKAYGEAHHIETWISMEERMACGIGACLACVCRSTETDAHSRVHNKRICKEGPVFLAGEVDLS